MVSKAREDFPDPLTQVMVMSLFFGKVRSISLRLWVLIPWKTISSSFSSGFIGVEVFVVGKIFDLEALGIT